MLLALSASDSKTRIRPEFSGQRAFCPVCGSEVVARCGRVNAWHWAHLSTTECDSWHESETEWHRQWKAEFPEANQEIVHFDSTTGEKHIADVKLDSGLVLEFQHSPISTEELASRCNFYKNILWIVDSRSNADLKRLLSGLGRRQPNLLLQRKNTAGLSWEFWDICSRLLVPNAEIYRIDDPWSVFRKGWNLDHPVVFDFSSEAESDNEKRPLVDAKQQDLLLSLCTNPFVREQIYLGLPKRIWCLFPPLEQRETYFAAAMRRRDFVKALLENGSILRERTPDETLAITLSKLKFPLKIPVQKKISTTQTFFGVSRRRSRRF